MRRTVSAFAICICFGGQAPVMAQDNLEGIISGVAQGLLSQELERQAVAEARRSGTLTAWRAYLTRFPNGAHRSEAEQEIARLSGAVLPTEPAPLPADSAAATEAALALSREQRRQFQSQLTSLGYDAGIADGLWGRKTREAIRAWQSVNSATVNGYMTERQMRQIREQAGTATLPADNAVADDRTEERLLGLTASERRDIQRRLTALGYNTRGTDGVLGQNSRRAIAAWQRDERLQASGYITADQLRELRRQTGA